MLTHDCCLSYYRHKRVSRMWPSCNKIQSNMSVGDNAWCSLQDEGKRPALSAVKLEGAEVGADPSLGKPFVFKCRPQSGSRVFFFCATSNQEMKR